MKLISLNTWGGRAGKKELLAFFEANKEVDVFCLQEIWSAPYHHLEGVAAGGLTISHSQVMEHALQEISALLSGHVPFFCPHHGDNYGLLMLIKKEIEILEQGEVYVHKYKDYVPEGDVGLHARNIQFVKARTSAAPITFINFHGLWNGQGKGDSGDRLLQSDNIMKFIQALDTEVVFCGDFNLNPETQSIQRIEAAGLKNLISEYGITTTRTSIYKKPEKFADYTFISPGIKVREFKVLPDVVSDHAPLYLEFN